METCTALIDRNKPSVQNRNPEHEMNIASSVESLIGSTPLIELARIQKRCGLKARILAKAEFLNPGGSIKDRVALSMIDTAEKEGKLSKGSTIIESTSGNTGIGLAMIAAARGYKTIIVMPENMSEERKRTMKAYGATVVLTEASQGMTGANRKASELAMTIPGSFEAGQFVNKANPAAHYRTTGPEIWNDTDGKVDIFVAGVGTGGTITGTGQYLKSRNPKIQIVAVEPENSAVLSGGKAGKHGLQGIGAGFVPQVLDTGIYDQIITVSDHDAYETGRLLCSCEGIFAGITSGAAAWAAMKIARLEENRGKLIAVILPDGGSKYLSTPLFEI
jgi:cysteine synthase A